MSRRRTYLPDNIKDLDFSQIQKAQVLVFADYMGCRHRLVAGSSLPEKQAVLKAHCDENPQRAQEGYEIIILKKMQTKAGAIPEDMERRMYQVLTDVVVQHRDSISDAATTKVTEAVEAVKADLTKYARDQIKLAAENARPLVLKEKGKKDRVVKGVLPKEFSRMVQLGHARKNILLVGPSGCGKTYLAAKLAEALGLDFAAQSCSAGISESNFAGWLLPIGKAGQFVYVPALFVKFYEEGGVFLIDEMDNADANLLVFLNMALANGTFYLPQRHENPVVKRHKDFVAVGAANTYGHGADMIYAGRNQLDGATLDRFRCGMITMDYSREVEESVGDASVLEWAWAVRKAIRDRSLERIMSTRVIQDMSDMKASADWGRKEWDEAYFADWTAEERNLIMQYLPAIAA